MGDTSDKDWKLPSPPDFNRDVTKPRVWKNLTQEDLDEIAQLAGEIRHRILFGK